MQTNLPPEGQYIIIALVVIGLLIKYGSMFTSRSRANSELAPGTPRDYGYAGGAICPRCARPFVLRTVALRFSLGPRLARCEFCGKWSWVARQNLDTLRAAEAAELAETDHAVEEKSEEEKLRERLDDSRYSTH